MQNSLPLGVADALALAFFLAAWVVFALAADGKLVKRISLTPAMNAQREAWMHTMARRELQDDRHRHHGRAAAGHGLLRLERADGDRRLLCAARRHRPGARRAVATCRSVATPARGVFEIKMIGLIVLFAYAFFKFGWSYRLFNYCSILIGAVPVLRDGATHSDEAEIAVRRAARMNMLGRQAFQRRPARRVLLDRLSRLVRRPGGVRAVDRCCWSSCWCGGSSSRPRDDALLDRASRLVRPGKERDRCGPTASSRQGRSIRGSPSWCSAANRRRCRGTGRCLPCPTCGSRPARNHRKAGLAEQADRARHVEGRGDQQPGLARFGRRPASCEDSAFSEVLRDLFSRISRSRGMPSAAKKRGGRVGIALAFQHHRADAAGDQDFRVGKAARQDRRLDETVAAAVHLIAAARQVDRRPRSRRRARRCRRYSRAAAPAAGSAPPAG